MNVNIGEFECPIEESHFPICLKTCDQTLRSRLCLSRVIVTDGWNLDYYATNFNIYETHCCTEESHLYL